jgi:t-SNARE complex subunit (syntaxin)
MFTGVDSVQQLASGINEELKYQNKELDKLDEDVQGNLTNIQRVNASLNKMLEENKNCSMWTIVILTIIVIIMCKFFDKFYHSRKFYQKITIDDILSVFFHSS